MVPPSHQATSRQVESLFGFPPQTLDDTELVPVTVSLLLSPGKEGAAARADTEPPRCIPWLNWLIAFAGRSVSVFGNRDMFCNIDGYQFVAG